MGAVAVFRCLQVCPLAPSVPCHCESHEGPTRWHQVRGGRFSHLDDLDFYQTPVLELVERAVHGRSFTQLGSMSPAGLIVQRNL